MYALHIRMLGACNTRWLRKWHGHCACSPAEVIRSRAMLRKSPRPKACAPKVSKAKSKPHSGEFRSPELKIVRNLGSQDAIHDAAPGQVPHSHVRSIQPIQHNVEQQSRQCGGRCGTDFRIHLLHWSCIQLKLYQPYEGLDEQFLLEILTAHPLLEVSRWNICRRGSFLVYRVIGLYLCACMFE